MRCRPTGTDTRLCEVGDRPRRVGLANSDDLGDAMPGGIALTLEPAEIGCGDGERAVIEELAHGLDRLADVATELGGGVAEDMDDRREGDRPSGGRYGSGCRR